MYGSDDCCLSVTIVCLDPGVFGRFDLAALVQPHLQFLFVCLFCLVACLQDEALAWQTAFKQRPPSEAIVFIVGGSTYEEAKAVHEWNAKGQGMRVILGGSEVLNSDQLLEALGIGAGSDLR